MLEIEFHVLARDPSGFRTQVPGLHEETGRWRSIPVGRRHGEHHLKRNVFVLSAGYRNGFGSLVPNEIAGLRGLSGPDLVNARNRPDLDGWCLRQRGGAAEEEQSRSEEHT